MSKLSTFFHWLSPIVHKDVAEVEAEAAKIRKSAEDAVTALKASHVATTAKASVQAMIASAELVLADYVKRLKADLASPPAAPVITPVYPVGATGATGSTP